MQILVIENELRDVVSRIITQVELSTKQNRYDINLALEDAFIPILKSIFNLSNLVNLNRKQKNYPGIDLGDEFDRVAFQITSSTNLEKVKKTITQFKDKKFYNSFDELFILMLTKKQSSYSQSAIDQITEDLFSFKTAEHIIDLGDLLERITGLRIPTQERILNEFKLILGEIDSKIAYLIDNEEKTHNLLSNLVSIEFPKNIYVADLIIDDKEIIKEARAQLNFKKSRANKSLIVKLALVLANKSSDAWVCYENKLFTFINLEKDSSIFSGIIDQNNIEILSSQDLYLSTSLDNLNIFKQLLHKATIERLKLRNVRWSQENKNFYFTSEQENRLETWIGKKKATRTVYEKVLSKKDPTKISHHKHLSFSLSFINIEDQWFGNIIPSWLYTYNGYKKSRFHEDLLSKQKRLEHNQSVKNLVRFLAYFLANDDPNKDTEITYKNLLEMTSETGAILTDALLAVEETEETIWEGIE
ncbi:SMEK domain-containing protein [Acinetobacter sp. SFA]|uniref:SMEK domain-containing protein n=1 Tax=Acinetobacter sp. SFA TaxID=1805633 RepID=UPI000A6736B7|nr:SMEK domain-containing protein [Acinetobacter sp. SFA]